jgi:hypothetical protein
MGSASDIPSPSPETRFGFWIEKKNLRAFGEQAASERRADAAASADYDRYPSSVFFRGDHYAR